MGTAAGCGIMAHGLDHYITGMNALFSGTPQETMTAQGLQQAGVPPNAAHFIDETVALTATMGAGVGASALAGKTVGKTTQAEINSVCGSKVLPNTPDCIYIPKSADEVKGFFGSKQLQLQNAPYQPVRNVSVKIGERDYSAHALDQMQNRGFMPSIVENAVQNGIATPGKYTGTIQHLDTVNNLRILLDSVTGRVITVIPGGK